MKVYLPIIWHELTHCIRDAWEAAGHEVKVYDWRTMHRRKGRDVMLAMMVDEVRRWKPDLVWMQIQAPGILTAAACEVIRQNCGFLCHWSGDVRHPLPEWYLQIAPHVDALLFSNMTDVDIVTAKGYNAAHLQIGYDPRIYNADGEGQREGVVFIGNNYGGYKYVESDSRRQLVRAMADEFGDDFKVYGLSWEGIATNCDMGYIREPGDADILKRSLVALNWDHFHRPWFSSDRLLRAAACGCDVVSQNYEGLEEEHPYTVGADSIEEVLQTVEYLLMKGGASGHANAAHTLAEHTWDARVPSMMDIMEQFKR